MTKIRPRVLVGAVCACILASAAGRVSAAEGAKPLPIKRIRLYEVGVGYFERAGVLRDGSELVLGVPAGHLDDALKSLVVLGGDGKTRISAVEFRSRESQALAQADAGLEDMDTSSLDFATALIGFKGALVEVKAGARTLRGRLTDVITLERQLSERCVVPQGAQAEQGSCIEEKEASIVVLSDAGELARAALPNVTSVRALEPAVAARMTRALAGVTQRASSERPVLRLHGAGAAPVTLGYIAETPVWRVSYRVVLGENGQASRVQGWALVHNDSDEPWQHVKLELANGRPTSFLYPLAAPRYAERELVTPDEQLSTVPQLLGKNPDDMWTAGSGGSYVARSPLLRGGVSTTGYGMGAGGAGIGVVADHDVASNVVSVGDLAELSAASGVESATQFRYTPSAAVDVAAHSSALVPFLNESIALEPITWFGGPGQAAETALRMSNSSAQTLPAGVASVFAEAGFSGETLLPRSKPGEMQVLRFGVDLDVSLAEARRDDKSQPQAYSYGENFLREHVVKSSHVSYLIRNKSAFPRTICLALDVVENARISGADAVSYDSTLAQAVLTFQVPAKSELKRDVEVSQGIMRNLPIGELRWWTLRELAQGAAVPAAQRAVLARAADEAYALAIRQAALPKREGEIEALLADIERLESHVNAIHSADDAHLAANELHAAEQRLSALRQRVAALGNEIDIYETRMKTALAALGGPARP